MGIPVVGKNFFPSNIQGLPTWYEIRVSKEGYLSRSGHVDLMVAMNAQTYAKDLAEVAPGGYLLYDSTWPRDKQLARDDITLLGVPLAELVNKEFENIRARILMKNVCYLGALAALLDIDMAVIEELLKETFADKAKLVAGNLQAIELGYAYAKEHFSCPLPLKLERLDKTAGHIMVDGNTMAGLGCVYAGATVGAWYPITPSTSLMDAFKEYCEELRVDKATGQNKFCIVQAEDELAAIGIVLGAAWNGARAFTPTSGPGISLMNEFIGFGYYTEIPAVIFDVQRVGPSTGMPTRTQQADILLAAYASHGDTRHVVLFPADPAECFHFAVTAFDLAERLQTPVFVLSDLDIGMNDWMVPKVKWDERYEPDRGKVYSKEELEGMQVFYRYTDVDGDAIPYRTLPGVHPKGAYFVRGSGHNRRGAYTEDAAEYQDVLDRLRKKSETAKTLVPAPMVKQKKGVTTGIISLGSCDGAVKEAMDILSRQGTDVNYLRVRAFPFSKEVEDFLDRHERIFVVEQNRDAQLKSLLLIETQVDRRKLHSILHYSGMPIDCRCIVDGVTHALATGVAA
ncbi:MAG TPA: 2-oxoacid:acceptor oxidoreductase subunit alpha, partial [Gammaproteobacteria bacterium]|nr:2-oxoacid:acceptor oxidoreductase subunit alpha [Gammaproteobacteria bacterium]